MTSGQLRIFPTLRIHDGGEAAFTDVLQECADVVAAHEPGTTTYDFWIGDGMCRGMEFFTDSAAFLAHFGGKVGTELMPRLLEHAALDSIVCYGEPTPEARTVLDQFGATVNGARTLGA